MSAVTLTNERIDILTTFESSRWRETLEEIGNYDSYQLPEYHALAESIGDGEAAMLVFRDRHCTIAFPMLIRPVEIDGLISAADGVKDATSVYGYPGPVCSVKSIPPESKRRFADALRDFLVQSRAISAFSRMNPIIGNTYILQGCGQIMDMGPTLSLDLTVPPEEQYKSFRRSHKVNIQRLRDSGVTCSEAGIAGVGAFAHIYRETMDRLNAADHYYFDEAYFTRLLSSMPNEAHLFLCWDGDLAISGMIALAHNGIVQGHLGGTLTAYTHSAPMKLAYDTVRLWGASRGDKTFHIGGGVNGRKDSLFAHKQGFSKREHMFHTWGYVVDQKVCSDLFQCLCQRVHSIPDDSYFPPYRHPALTGATECGVGRGE